MTGAAGFVGSNIVKTLNAIGYEVYGYDTSLTPEKWPNLQHELVRWVDIDRLSGFGPEAVVHCGWKSDTGLSPAEYMPAIVDLEKLIQYCNWENAHLVFISSAAIYGNATPEPSHRFLPHAAYPLNAYAWSKSQGEYACYLSRLEKLTVLRLFNVYGPGEGHKGKMASMLYQMRNTWRRGEMVKLFKSTDPDIAHGDQTRDHIYVDDVTRIIADVLQYHHHGCFDVGTGLPATWNELAALCAGQCPESRKGVGYKDMPEHIQRTYQTHTKANIEPLISREIVPPRTVDRGVVDYYRHLSG